MKNKYVRPLLCGLVALIVSGPSNGALSGNAPNLTYTPNADLFDTADAVAVSVYEHPGGLHTQAQLNYVRKQVIDQVEPWDSAYDQLLSNADSWLSESPRAMPVFTVPRYYGDDQAEHTRMKALLSEDACVAYSCALVYQLNINLTTVQREIYADKAMEFLNNWASVNVAVAGAEVAGEDSLLTMCYNGTALVFAAELLWDYSGWSTTDKNQFKSWAGTVLSGAASIKTRSNNWANWGIMASLAVNHILDDTSMMASDIDRLKANIDQQIEPDGSMPAELSRGGNSVWYTYFALTSMTAAIEIARNADGIDLYPHVPPSGGTVKDALDFFFQHAIVNPSSWPVAGASNSMSPSGKGGNLFYAMGRVYEDEDYLDWVSHSIWRGKTGLSWICPSLMSPFGPNSTPYDNLPEIDITGNGNSITNGDITPVHSDHTDFGSTYVGGSTIVKTYTVTNSGGALLTLSSGATIAVGDARFTVTSAPLTGTELAPDATTTFDVTYTPDAVVGTHTVTVSLSSDDGDEGTYNFDITAETTAAPEPEIDVTGNSVSIPDGDATPSTGDHTDFGSTSPSGPTIVRTYTVTNSGTALLTLTDPATVTGAGAAQFAVGTLTDTTMNNGETATFTVTYTASAGSAVHNATVSLSSADGDEGTYTFAITAETTAAPGIVAITSVNTTTSGTVGDPQTIILDSFTVGGVTYITNRDLVTGTSNVGVQGQDNFDLRQGDFGGVLPLTTILFGGANWSNSNGDAADFFIFESNGNDTLKVRPIFANDSVGEYVEIANSDGSNWGQLLEDDDTVNSPLLSNGVPQTIHGVAFAITDLKGASGEFLTNSAVIKGLAFDASGADMVSISAVAVVPVAVPVPVANNSSVTSDQDVAVAVTLSASDADNDALTYSIVSGPSNGALSGNAPNLTYTPSAGFFGSDSFTFKANDGTVDSNVATVSITVNEVIPPNEAPVANNSSATSDQDVAVAVTLSASDADKDALTYSIVSGPSNGALSGNAPNLTYTSNADFFGSDSFTFKANDGTLDSNIATASITVNEVISPNEAPVANNSSVTSDQDVAVAVTLSASDADNDALTYSIVSWPSNGALSGNAPNLTYTSNADFFGSDSFTFKANDGTVDSNTATVSITVNEVISAGPAIVAITSVSTTSFGSPEQIVLDSFTAGGILYTTSTDLVTGTSVKTDGSALNGRVIGDQDNFDLNLYFGRGGNAIDNTWDTISFGGENWSNSNGDEADFFIFESGGNDSVSIRPIFTDGSEGQFVVFSVKGGDSTNWGDTGVPITVGPRAGQNIFGMAFAITDLVDADGVALTNSTVIMGLDFDAPGTDIANISAVAVAPVAVPVPVANNSSVTSDQDVAVAVTLSASNADGDGLTYSIVSGPSNGALSGNAPNLTYTPNTDFFGSDSFTFKANDGTVDSNTATVSITVNEVIPPNEAPVANNSSVTSDQDVAVAVTLSASDADNDALTYSIVSWPSNGALSGNAPNLTYTSNADFFGSDSFTFKANDGTVDSNTATVSITVNEVIPPNEAPVANISSVTSDQDVAVAVTLSASDADNDALTYSIVSWPSNGALSGNAPNLTYTSNADFFGSDSFTFKANDGTVDSNTATVSITVNEVISAGPAIVAITSVSTTSFGSPEQIVLDSFTAGGILYSTSTDLVTGTSVKTDGSALKGRVIADQDNFDLNLYFGRGGNAIDNTWETISFGGENWSNSNGDEADFFIFESGGNDSVSIRPIFTDGLVGQFVVFSVKGGDSTNWGDTGVPITVGPRAGQNIFGMAFAITDLVDADGVALTNSTVIMGLDFDAPGTDIASISAVAVADVYNLTVTTPSGLGGTLTFDTDVAPSYSDGTTDTYIYPNDAIVAFSFFHEGSAATFDQNDDVYELILKMDSSDDTPKSLLIDIDDTAGDSIYTEDGGLDFVTGDGRYNEDHYVTGAELKPVP